MAFSDIQDNKVFVLEKGEKRIYSYMGYTSDFRNVASVMDARQKRVSYTYDEGDRIKSIQHGGTTYAFEYDGFGNQTMVKAGDKTLDNYRSTHPLLSI